MAPNGQHNEYDIPMEDALGLDELLGPKLTPGEEGRKKRRGVADKAVDTLVDTFSSRLKPQKTPKKEVDAFLEQVGSVADLEERTRPKGSLDDFLSGKPVAADDLYEQTTPRGDLGAFLSGRGAPAETTRAPVQPERAEVFDLEGGAPSTVFDLEADAGDLSAWIGGEKPAAPSRPAEPGETVDLELEGEVLDLGQFAETPPLTPPPVADEEIRWGEETPALDVTGDLGSGMELQVLGEEAPPLTPPPVSADTLRDLEAEIFQVTGPVAPPEPVRPMESEAFTVTPSPFAEPDLLYGLVAPPRAAPKRPAAAPVVPSGLENIQPRFDLDDLDTPLFPLNDDVTAYTVTDIGHPVIPLVASPFDLVEAPSEPFPGAPREALPWPTEPAEEAGEQAPPAEFTEAPFSPAETGVEGPQEIVAEEPVPLQLDIEAVETISYEPGPALSEVPEPPADYPEGDLVIEDIQAQPVELTLEVPEAGPEWAPEMPEAEGEPSLPQEPVAEVPEPVSEWTEEAEPGVEEIPERAQPEQEITTVAFVPLTEPPPGEPLTVELPTEEETPLPPAPAFELRSFRFTLTEFPSVEDVLPPLNLPTLSFELPEIPIPSPRSGPAALEGGESPVAVLEAPPAVLPEPDLPMSPVLDRDFPLAERSIPGEGIPLFEDIPLPAPAPVEPELTVSPVESPLASIETHTGYQEETMPTINEIAAIGHDLATNEGIEAANAAVATHVTLIGQKVSELRRIQEARARMNSAYRQLQDATSRGAPLEQVIPLMKELQELKESGTPMNYQAGQLDDLLTKAEEARIIIEEYLRVLRGMEQHECCLKAED